MEKRRGPRTLRLRKPANGGAPSSVSDSADAEVALEPLSGSRRTLFPARGAAVVRCPGLGSVSGTPHAGCKGEEGHPGHYVAHHSALPGIGDVPGCGCGLHPGGVGPPGPLPEGALLGRDAGELQEPGLPGSCGVRWGRDLSAGVRESTWDSTGQCLKSLLVRWGH
ncbi:uncharacterized protein LOC141556266 isoform X7 [Sminthopsis crassicaudata]|uniref:uncharacterized protein LOC141556266 isoform X7 n=1 Tax=Sminthopsis crassicaudata TaxID=9301 RepID=UPI003D69B611